MQRVLQAELKPAPLAPCDIYKVNRYQSGHGGSDACFGDIAGCFEIMSGGSDLSRH